MSLGFSKGEYWNGLPYPIPRDLPNPGIEPEYLTSLALAGGFFTTSTTWEACGFNYQIWVAQLQKVIEEATDSSIPNNPCARPLTPLSLLAPELVFTVVAEVSYGEKCHPNQGTNQDRIQRWLNRPSLLPSCLLMLEILLTWVKHFSSHNYS